MIPMDLQWPAQLCRDGHVLCLPRHKGDQEATDTNTLLRDALARANDIFMTFRLEKKAFNLDTFMEEWGNNFSKDNFIVYYEQKMMFRYRSGDITADTLKSHRTTLNWLIKFNKMLYFSSFEEEWGCKFDSFLSKGIKSRTGNTQNTRWSQHKNVRAYLNLARKHEKLRFLNPLSILGFGK